MHKELANILKLVHFRADLPLEGKLQTEPAMSSIRWCNISKTTLFLIFFSAQLLSNNKNYINQ
ncbi:hypothetical protein BOQ04_07605 [Polynucleobacter sphagniphilus]|nr:hypothetical protein BOQ04_07605 [Polynucleobacter sphagniphilus]